VTVCISALFHSVYLSVYLYTRDIELFLCLSVSLSISIQPSVTMRCFISVCLSALQLETVHLSVYLSVCSTLCIHLPGRAVYLSFCLLLFTHLPAIARCFASVYSFVCLYLSMFLLVILSCIAFTAR